MPQAKIRVLFIERQSSRPASIELVFRAIAEDLPADRFDVEFQQVPYGTGLSAIVRNLFDFRPKAADIFHVTGDIHYISLVLPPEKTVLTVHDLVFLRNRSGIRRWLLKKLFLDWPLKRLRHLTAVSAATLNEIAGYGNELAAKVRVIENPLFGRFTDGRRKQFNVSEPLILQIGTAPNKNVPALIRAIAGIRCRLRIIGPLDDNILRELRSNNTTYENMAWVDGDSIADEYHNADIVAFCSTYEGFGLPIIEAQAMKRPVVTSSIEPMRSVAGNGAVFVDPESVESIRAGITRLIQDDVVREEAVREGAENVKRFAPAAIASRYAELYKEIVEGR